LRRGEVVARTVCPAVGNGSLNVQSAVA